MTAPAAIKGTFSDFKIIRGRKVAQLVIEIPLEEADAALTVLGGLPRPDAERWLAIARLDASKAQESPAKERRAFCDLPMSQQAALKSNDPAFQRFMNTRSEEECATSIKNFCIVKSRKDIIDGERSGLLWLTLLRDFEGVR